MTSSSSFPYQGANTPYLMRILPRWLTDSSETSIQALHDSQHSLGEPAWLAQASPQARRALDRSLERSRLSHAAAARSLKGIKAITEFCEPLLVKALEDTFGQALNVRSHEFFHLRDDASLRADRLADVLISRQSLLQAALQNFETPALQALQYNSYSALAPSDALAAFPSTVDPQRRASDSISYRSTLAITPAQFAQMCRSLDLGRQYQQHLDARFSAEGVAQALQTAARDALEVATHRGLIQRYLDQDAYATLRGLLAQSPVPSRVVAKQGSSSRYQGAVCAHVSLLGVPLHDVLLIGIEPDDQPYAVPCICYTPGAPDFEIKSYESRQAFYLDLHNRLADSAFKRYLLLRAPRELLAQFSAKLANDGALEGSRPQLTLVHGDLFAALHRAFLQKTKGDARSIAVPTADANYQAWLQALQQYLDLGLNLLNLAAFFVPGAGPVMLAVMGAQLMGEIFHGIEAWEENDKDKALGYLKSVAFNAATTAALGAGAAAVARTVEFAEFADELVPIQRPDGQLSLWRPALEGYAQGVDMAGQSRAPGSGVFENSGRHWITLEGETYAVRRDARDGQWRIQHPVDAQAFQPLLVHNGAGAWRLAAERPLEWSGVRLLRRLGHRVEGLSDADLLQVQRFCGVSDEQLRGLHLGNQPLPALLADAIERYQLVRSLDVDLLKLNSGQPVSGTFKSVQPLLVTRLPGWPVDKVLRVVDAQGSTLAEYGADRAEENLRVTISHSDVSGDQTLLRIITATEEGAEGTPVLTQAQVAELTGEFESHSIGAQVQALEKKLASHLALDKTPTIAAMFDNVALPIGEEASLLKRAFPRLSNQVAQALFEQALPREREALFQARPSVPLSLASEVHWYEQESRLNQAYEGLYLPGMANADSRRLATWLHEQHPELPDDQPLPLAELTRPQARRLLGFYPIPVQPPRLRLLGGGASVGRLLEGYADPLRLRLRILHPGSSETELSNAFAEIDRRGLDREGEIVRLEAEFTQLRRSLDHWRGVAPGEHADAELRAAYGLRQTVAERIIACWQRTSRADRGAHYLDLHGLSVYNLPDLGVASFEHVESLHLNDMGHAAFPVEFLNRFPGVRWFNASGNLLGSVPQGIEGMRNLAVLELASNEIEISFETTNTLRRFRGLRELDLTNNRIVFDDYTLRVLADLPLQRLYLSANAITLTPARVESLARMHFLHQLDLSENPLGLAPDLSGMANLQYLGLRRTQITQWPAGIEQRIGRADIDLSDNQIVTIPLQGIQPAINLMVERSRLGRLDLGNNPLDEGAIAYLRELESEHRENLGVDVSNVVEEGTLQRWLQGATAQEQDQWVRLRDEQEAQGLFNVLERLIDSAEFASDREGLSQRVRVLVRACTDGVRGIEGVAIAELRQRVFALADSFPVTCGDAGADGFSTLENLLLIQREVGNAQGEQGVRRLARLFRRLFRRDQVEQWARQIITTRRARQQVLRHGSASDAPPRHPLDTISDNTLRLHDVDDIEIRLDLRLSLRKRLDYPEPTSGMLYEAVAEISDQTRKGIEAAVRSADTLPAVRTWMVANEGWRNVLQREFAPRFAASAAPWHSGQDYLYECGRNSVAPLAPVAEVALDSLRRALPDRQLEVAGELVRIELTSQEAIVANEAMAAGERAATQQLVTALTEGMLPEPHVNDR